MEAEAATPVRRPAEPSSPSPTPLSLRQWRPAAQRNLRNQWSRLLAAKARWLAADASGRSHAAALVNAYLSRRYLPFSLVVCFGRDWVFEVSVTSC
jgi:hypothetical protein